ncbi:MAG: chromosome segregation protein SMC [Parvibaculaceae bacterium]
MRFSRLRLSGFKSFVEPTELVIEPGLTGVVGPNGCGKSNLLEALRWVMGESSTKSMRASGMDDVIFSGTSGRPARNMAEVTLTLDNGGRTAPLPFNEADTIEVSRRIEREAGSAYRINGADSRARDVQLLFADASTGARSPALVRQGQIGELINSKPQARRRILEEAAGITGLHTRRHEAELKLNAAEANLARLEDVIGQLDQQLQALKRQARQATRYKQLSADIRRLEAAQLLVAWRDAEAQVRDDEKKLEAATLALAEATREASEHERAREAASEALPPLREAEAVRSAVLQRLTHERDGLDREVAEAEARKGEIEKRLHQILQDLSREHDLLNDARSVTEKLAAEEESLNREQEGQAEARVEAARAMQAAADALADAQEKADHLHSRFSRLTAERGSLERVLTEARQRAERLDAELDGLKGKHAALTARAGAESDGEALAEAVQAAAERLRRLEGEAAEAESEALGKRRQEAEQRQAHEEARRAADRLMTEVRTLSKLLAAATGDLWPKLVDAIEIAPGLEAAIAAALGDDIDAPVDESAPLHWRALPEIEDMAPLPEGATPLTGFASAPAALSRRLAATGLVDRAEGKRLQPLLRPGQRLVSREGDLWRWDGFSAAADAPTAAAMRLAERNRLGSLEVEAEAAQRQADGLRQSFETQRQAAEAAAAAERRKRQDAREASVSLDQARGRLAAHERALAEHRRELGVLAEASRRVEEAAGEAREAATGTEAKLGGLELPDTLEAELDGLRNAAAGCRTAYNEARALHDGIEGEARRREGRLKAIGAERAQWDERTARAERQVGELDRRAGEARTQLSELAELPARFEERRVKLMSMLAEAEAARKEAADALQTGENALRAGEAAHKAAQQHLGETREEHARQGARAESARERLAAATQRIAETMQCPPGRIAEIAGLDEAKIPEDVDGKLQQLKDARERLGPVNLRAEEEAEAVGTEHGRLVTERDDVVGAIHKLRGAIGSLNREGRERLLEAFGTVNAHFGSLFTTLFQGGKAELKLIESDDPLEAGLELVAHPPGKRPQVLSLLSGGEQALTAMALIFAVFLTNPSPICVLDEVDAPLDDYNVERFCNLLDAMLQRSETRFLIITHNPITMARMNRLFGVTMAERGVSQLVSVDLGTATRLREAS